MSVILAIVFMIAVGTAGSALSVLTGLPVMLLIMLGSAAWAYSDAERIGLERYRTGLRSPVAVAVGCIFLWVIAFPWYLHVRHQITSGRMQPDASLVRTR